MKKHLIIGSLVAFMIAGCAAQNTATEAVAEEVATPAPTPVEPVAAPELAKILFAFDKYDIADNMIERIDVGAKGLVASNVKVTLEGNTDSFGSDEYNYALGTKRANAVKEALVIRGVNADNISLVSYGESKPTCEEKTKECYQQNRRVEFVITK